jgi:large subunit ribosomal protein L15
VVSSKKTLVKVLGHGELSKAITVHAHKFSKSAQEKIEKAGGKIQVVSSQ